jgi:hypothetical protein
MSNTDAKFFDQDGFIDHEKAAQAGRAAQSRHVAAGLRACRRQVLQMVFGEVRGVSRSRINGTTLRSTEQTTLHRA